MGVKQVSDAMFLQRLWHFVWCHITILKNSLCLSIIEFIHFLIPFVALPYIIKVVGGDNYGKIVFAQVVVGYFLIFVNFGFDILAVRYVSRNRNSKPRLQIIVGTILSLKSVTFLVSFLLFSAMVFFWDKAKVDWLLYFSAYLMCLTELFFTPWFFQGIEKMFVITVVRCVSMGVYIITLFLFLHEKQQYWLVPLLQSGALLVTALYGSFYMVCKEKVLPVLPSKRFMKKFFKESYPFFLSRSSVILNNSLATLAIGLSMTSYNVAVYELARKIANAVLIPISMLIQAIYPHNALKRDRRFAMIAFCGLLGVGLLSVATVYFLAPYLVDFLGNHQFSVAVPILRFLLIQVMLCVFTYYLGTPLLVAWGYSKPFNDSVIIASVFLMLIYGVVCVFPTNSIYLYASAVILSEVVVMLYRGYYCLKFGILKFG